jgi:murein DD-endopeptidase MepM/ murein hydrolase activator NlpD
MRSPGVEDKANQYLQLAATLDEQGQSELADEYRSQALAAAGQPLAAVSDPIQTIQQIIKTKIQEREYNKQAQALEDQLNPKPDVTQAPAAQTQALVPSKGISLKGVQITSPVDTSGEPGFDFVIPGGRGAQFQVPFKAQVLKVVNDPWETNLEKGPGRRGYGNYVDVRGVDPTTGKSFDVRLAHFDKLNPGLKPGVVIEPGTFIGTQGRSGSTTGAHVSADFYEPGKNVASAEILKIRDQIRDRLAKGLPVF